jgi:drug/metabolite transporter (DMT)-like permease
MTRRSAAPKTVLIAYFALVLMAGANAVAIRYTQSELAPLWSAAARFVPASLLFFLGMVVFRIRLPRGRELLGDLVFGTLFFGVGFGCFALGISRVGAGRAQVVFAAIPLVTLVLAVMQGLERMTWRGVFGATLTIAGFALVFARPADATGGPSGVAVLLLGAVAIGEAMVVFKSLPASNAIATNAVAMTAGSCLILLLSAATGEEHAIPSTSETWVAVAYLASVGSVVVSILNLFVLSRLAASTTSYQFVLFPFVAVALGAWLLHEPVTPVFAIGASLVLSGAYIGALRGQASGGKSSGRPHA